MLKLFCMVAAPNTVETAMNFKLKELGPIASDFCQSFWDFGIRINLIIYFSWPLVNFMAEKMYRWEDIDGIMTSYGNHN